MNRPVMSGAGLYDPTSIMNADTLNKCQVRDYLNGLINEAALNSFIVERRVD